MLLDQKNLRKILQKIDKSKIIHIICNRNLHSVCSLFVFTQILKKELFKYQIEFRNMEKLRNFYFEIENEEYVLSNHCFCECDSNEIHGIYVLYSVIKAMNFVKVETVWPMAVCYEYYKEFMNPASYHDNDINKENLNNNKESLNNNKESLNDKGSNKENLNNRFINHTLSPQNKDNLNNKNNNSKNLNNKQLTVDLNEKITCRKCSEIYDEISFSIKSLNCRFDGIFSLKSIRLDFLMASTLSQSMKNDLRFIHEKKLFYTKSTYNDRKIGEFLARRGISINASNENYLGLDSFTKKLCDDTFGLTTKFVFKSGHDLEMTGVEHSFLLLFYMYKEKDIYSYMSLEKRKLIDLEKASKFYYKMIHLFKEGILTASRLKNTVVFKVKNEDFTVDQMVILSDVLKKLFKIYLKFRNEDFCEVLVYFPTENDKIILSIDENTILDENKGLGENVLCPGLIKININDIPSVIN